MSDQLPPWRADFDDTTTLDDSFTQELWDLKYDSAGSGGWAWAGDDRVEGDPAAPTTADELVALANREINARIERIEALKAAHGDQGDDIEEAWQAWCRELRERCQPRRHRR